MDKLPVHIGIIDDGVNENLYDTELIHNIEITQELKIYRREKYNSYKKSHGTICAGIIKKYSPEAKLSSIKILSDSGTGIREQLVKAIEWCIDNNINLINMSLGTIDFRDFDILKDSINCAYKKGIIIVAASNNKDVVTYPSSFSNVIGVKCDRSEQLQEGQYIYNYYAPDGIDITAFGSHSLIGFWRKSETFGPVNSFAAPYITAVVHDMMKNHPGIQLEGIRDELRTRAVNSPDTDYIPNLCGTLDWIEKAVIFNIFRNCGTAYQAELPFRVESCITVKCDSVYNAAKGIKEFALREYALFSQIDTLVLLVNSKELDCLDVEFESFLKSISELEKNIVYIDEKGYRKVDLSNLTKNNSLKLWHPYSSIYFNKVIKNIADNEAPLIVVYDSNGDKLINAVSKLAEYFRKDGYYAVASTDKAIGVIAGLEYTPLQNGLKADADCCSNITGIKMLRSIYPADVLILGIDGSDKEKDFLSVLESTLEIDLKVLIANNGDAELEKMIEFDTESQLLIVAQPETNAMTSSCRSVKAIWFKEDMPLREVYNYILELFDDDKNAGV
ncbi:MAG: S8 family serine peptidase [Clostridia bacterium]|nr:S8 family serine peptidase [Clostridia bacterium]